MLKDLVDWLNQRNDGKYIVHSAVKKGSAIIVRGPFTEEQYLKEVEDLSFDDFVIKKLKEIMND